MLRIVLGVGVEHAQHVVGGVADVTLGVEGVDVVEVEVAIERVEDVLEVMVLCG